MKLLNILKVERTFLEELQYELEDVFSMFIDFFKMIKENTYDVLLEKFGEDINVAFLLGGTIVVMIVVMAIINGDHKS